MNLSVFERLILLNVLPREGSLVDLRIVRDLQDALAFSEQEQADLDIHQEGESVRWKEDADAPKDVEIGARASEIIRDTFGALDKGKKLRVEHLPIYERFLEAADGPKLKDVSRG